MWEYSSNSLCEVFPKRPRKWKISKKVMKFGAVYYNGSWGPGAPSLVPILGLSPCVLIVCFLSHF